MTRDRLHAWKQLAISYAITNGLVFAMSRPVAMRYQIHELIGALFLAGGLISIRLADDDTERHGVRLGGLFPGRQGDDRSLLRALWESLPSAAREIAAAVAVAAVVLPAYAYFWPWFNRPPAVRHFSLDPAHLRDIVTNLFAVALTEELYFRGYVQTRLADALGVPPDRQHRSSPRSMAIPIVLASALFALTHVIVEVTPQRGAVFFPGLLFGAVRVWRGGIGAATVLHASCNIFESWLEGR